MTFEVQDLKKIIPGPMHTKDGLAVYMIKLAKKVDALNDPSIDSQKIINNIVHKAYVSIREGDMTITECFKDDPQLRENLNNLWINLAKIDTFFPLRNPTPEQIEEGARGCENWYNQVDS